jgi:hypothetical protein
MVRESIWKEGKYVMSVERILPVTRERLITIRDDALLTNGAGLLDGRHINLIVSCDSGGHMVALHVRLVHRRLLQWH